MIVKFGLRFFTFKKMLRQKKCKKQRFFQNFENIKTYSQTTGSQLTISSPHSGNSFHDVT